MHFDLITSISRHLLSTQLGVFKCTSPCAPLTSFRSTVAAQVRHEITSHKFPHYHSRCRVSERNSKSLNQITAACPHTRPKGKTVFLWARDFGENQCCGCFADPGRGRAEGEVWAEPDGFLCVDKTQHGEDGEVSEGRHGEGVSTLG